MTHPWNELIARLPNPHFLQTYEWAQVKAAYGWQPLYAVWSETEFSVESEFSARKDSRPQAATLLLKKSVLSRGLAARVCIFYAPKGPLLNWDDVPLRQRVLADLERLARQQGAIFLKLDPDVVLGRGLPGSEAAVTEPGGAAVRADFLRRGWRFSEDQIQFRNTVTLDLHFSEEELLARMKQKTRYNLRLAQKKGVVVRVGNESDWAILYRMYAETSARDGFVIRDENYYRTVWRLFNQPEAQTKTVPLAEPLIAEVDGEPIAAIFLFAFAGRAYYVYGMSRAAHREKMPAYLLQWEAIRWAQARGCTLYDLWGAPDIFAENDRMWGVFRFKEGLGGQVICTLGAWDFVPNPLWYGLYAKVAPMLLGALRPMKKRFSSD